MESLKSPNNEVFYSSLMVLLYNQLPPAAGGGGAGLLVEAVSEWIMDASQLPPESICALHDVSEAFKHNRVLSGDILALRRDGAFVLHHSYVSTKYLLFRCQRLKQQFHPEKAQKFRIQQRKHRSSEH